MVTVKRGNPYPLGATVQGSTINFSIAAPEAEHVALILEDEQGQEKETIELTEYRVGDVFSANVSGILPGRFFYYYIIDGERKNDPRGRIIQGKEIWGQAPVRICSGVLKEDSLKVTPIKCPIALKDTIIYRAHLRGFTMGSEVKHPGTFQGMIEKIPYLRELGITLLELMPVYDFDEIACRKSRQDTRYYNSPALSGGINYWGYTGGDYFAPKTSYSAAGTGEGAVREFGRLISALHRAQIEIGMEFYFPEDIAPEFALACLRYWVLVYRVDALHLSCDRKIVELAMDEPMFARTKIFSNFYIEPSRESKYKHTACYQESFMINARQFLRGDQDKVRVMGEEIKKNPEKTGVIHYVSNHNTFTLYDAVSYERKYNDANGEQNRDGTDYNYSWNCGAEGETNKKSVLSLRKRQMKNILAMLLLSQGIPMLMAGDERGNTQGGNNNPYNQDNEIGWLDWKRSGLQREMLACTKELIRLRKEHGIFRAGKELLGIDHLGLGFPDISFHGSTAWFFDAHPANRYFSVLYNGAYGEPAEEAIYYVAYNMNWESQIFGIPAVPKEYRWRLLYSTAALPDTYPVKTVELPERCIAVFEAKKRKNDAGEGK